jgi:pre-mRNA cleavage complex 2 protein Pcf11
LNSKTLADLIQATANHQNHTPLPPQPSQSFFQPPLTTTPPPTSSSAAATAAAENPLIASLRARGLLPPTIGGPLTPATPNLPLILPGHSGFTPNVPTTQMSNPGEVTINVQMTSASIRMSVFLVPI